MVGHFGRTLAIAALAIGALTTGCDGDEFHGHAAADEIQFGTWQPDDDRAMRFVATANVPNEEDQAYGWRVRVAESDTAVKWVETLTLPEAPESWDGVEDDPNVMISEDGRTATTVGTEIPDGGYLEGVWFVAFDDPPGEYVMSVELSDGRSATFTFRLGEPAHGVGATATGVAPLARAIGEPRVGIQ